MSIRVPAFLLPLVLLASALPAFAAPGELAAVERRCGAPGAEDQRVSPVTNQMERTLIYRNALYLHFEPVQGGWEFISAWNGHLPMTRGELERRLPCFRDAMQDAAGASTLSIDPAIAAQTVHQPANEGTFGIPHFALMIILVVVLLAFLLIPSARQRQLKREASKPVEHVYRKPNMDEYTSSTSIPVAKPIDHDLQ